MASSGRKEEKPWKMKSEDATSVSQSFVCVSCVAPSGKKGSWTYFKKKTRDASKRRGGGKLQTPIWLQPVDRITSFSFSFYWTLLYILLLLLLYAHQFIDRLSFWQVWDLTVESLRGGGFTTCGPWRNCHGIGTFSESAIPIDCYVIIANLLIRSVLLTSWFHVGQWWLKVIFPAR